MECLVFYTADPLWSHSTGGFVRLGVAVRVKLLAVYKVQAVAVAVSSCLHPRADVGWLQSSLRQHRSLETAILFWDFTFRRGDWNSELGSLTSRVADGVTSVRPMTNKGKTSLRSGNWRKLFKREAWQTEAMLGSAACVFGRDQRLAITWALNWSYRGRSFRDGLSNAADFWCTCKFAPKRCGVLFYALLQNLGSLHCYPAANRPIGICIVCQAFGFGCYSSKPSLRSTPC